jgi:HK97 gp10 family phage protein
MEGVRLNHDAIEQLFRSPTGPVAVALARKAIKVETTAKRLCPVDTGRLRASITHEMGEDSLGLVAYVGSNVEYAIFQELGTRFQPAQPYLRPALRAVT